MFKLLRYYSVASLVAVLVTAVVLTWFYRQVAIEGIVQLAERSNLTLARAAMNPIKPALLEFLDAAADVRSNSPNRPPLPPELAESIKTLMQDRSVARIKIYNRHGVVAFSTRPAHIGEDKSRNPGFIAAINGGVGSALIYRDTFNRFDDATEDDNLMQTYVPVQSSPAEPVQGVFELYTDVNGLVHQTERTEFIIMAGATLILSALYAVLVLIVRRSGNLVEQQQRTIRERTETLELLSAHMLKSEESHKQKIAFDLHEGLAQTLSALKLKVEHRQYNHKTSDAAAGSEDSIIPILQKAIQEVRTIATDLRPPSLDDLGLLPTINWLCREFEAQHPGSRIERQIALQERDIPNPLKVILYRIIVSVLDDMAQHKNAVRIQLALWLDDDTLILLIDDTPTEALDRTVTPLMNIDPQLRAGFARMEELTTLSGGVFKASHHSGGGTTLRAAWNR
jgi:signal transduction histidine kinase